jgi:hypothetical protein
VFAAMLTPVAAAQSNLLVNGGFDTGLLTPWTIVAGNAAIAPYGTPDLPGPAVAATIAGNGMMLRDVANGAVEQVVTLPSFVPGSSLVVEGYLGGGTEDNTRLVVRFLDGAGNQVGSLGVVPYVTPTERNFEEVLLYREHVQQIPATAARAAIRIEFQNVNCCSGNRAAADELSAHVVAGSTIPAPWPLDTELLGNPGFEGGWSGGSPLTLIDPRGWEGAGATSCVVRPYSASNPQLPNGTVSCAVSGAFPNPSCGAGAAGNLLGHTGNGAVRQRLDVRGNTPQFAPGAHALRIAAVLGGDAGEDDTARVDVVFRRADGATLATGTLPALHAFERNYETVVMRREAELPVPANTGFIELTVTFADANCCSGARGLIDNVSAMLVVPNPPPAVPLGTNLLVNASFEGGSVGGSPLTLDDARGWAGSGSARCLVVPYGSSQTPPPSFANGRALGAQLLRDGGNSRLRQVIDLRGSSALIAAGRLAMQASGWFGGDAAEADTAEAHVEFFAANHASVGQFVLPPVTAAERQNATTLLLRTSAPFAVPFNAAYVVFETVFTDFNCCSGARGLADDVRLVAFDVAEQSTGSPFPGTGGDLVLMTGVDELPRTGLGHYVKSAQPLDVLRTVAGSPNGILDGAPMILAVDVFVTGSPPAPNPGLPGLAVDPFGAVAIFNGIGGGVVGPVVIALAQGGNVWNQRIPPGFANTSLLIQAVCLPLPGAPAPNGMFFSSEGHEIRLQ